ncbi:MAG: hypothetical protein Q8927_01450 [Bacteroidota bacterium]|nr:hypothetical protein [Bacteroidota bacterium]MDP4214835.1 hypothetical protein [Bacteroidota bacterium]MDP4247823.1 hypothetical protein [Bacteroidota bacterium]MDP4253137.1 hypothetical protein [Bacteroidota bacterium]MDP4259033.1 hypothetical protein [Bacteroidota bacterium]
MIKITPAAALTTLIAAALLAVSLPACKGRFKKKGSADVSTDLSKLPGINAGAGTFSLLAPNGWRNYDTTLNGIKFRFIQAPRTLNPHFTPNMNIFSEKISEGVLDAYFNGVHLGARKSIDYEEIGSGTRKIDGRTARWLQYSSTSKGGTHMEIIFTAMIADGICYNITMATARGEMVKYKPSFDTVLNSLKIGRPTPERVR